MKGFILLCLCALFVFTIFKEECRKSYENGYRVGWDTALRKNGKTMIATLAYVYDETKPEGKRWKYVGVGNEYYSEDLEKLTGRNHGKYWWAEKVKED